MLGFFFFKLGVSQQHTFHYQQKTESNKCSSSFLILLMLSKNVIISVLFAICYFANSVYDRTGAENSARLSFAGCQISFYTSLILCL